MGVLILGDGLVAGGVTLRMLLEGLLQTEPDRRLFVFLEGVREDNGIHHDSLAGLRV